MLITAEFTEEEQRIFALVGIDFNSWLQKKAKKQLNLVTDIAKQKVVEGKTFTELEEFTKS